jgi:hypothetical protein
LPTAHEQSGRQTVIDTFIGGEIQEDVFWVMNRDCPTTGSDRGYASLRAI